MGGVEGGSRGSFEVTQSETLSMRRSPFTVGIRRRCAGQHTCGTLSTLLTRLVTQIQRHKGRAHAHTRPSVRSQTRMAGSRKWRKETKHWANRTTGMALGPPARITGCPPRGRTYLANKHWLICWQSAHSATHTHTHSQPNAHWVMGVSPSHAYQIASDLNKLQ